MTTNVYIVIYNGRWFGTVVTSLGTSTKLLCTWPSYCSWWVTICRRVNSHRGQLSFLPSVGW